MATMTKFTSGTTNNYLITDQTGNTLTVTLVTGLITGLQPTFVSSVGGLHADGINMLAQLMLEMGTGVVP